MHLPMKLEWKTCWKVGLSIFLLYLAIHYWPAVGDMLTTFSSAASPLLIACLMAYVLNLLMGGYEHIYFPKSHNTFIIRSRRVICLILAIVTLLAILSLVVGIVVPELVSCLGLIVSEIPVALEFISSHIDDVSFLPEAVQDLLTQGDWTAMINRITATVSQSFDQVLNITLKTVTSVFSGVISAFLAIIFTIYILATKERLGRQFHALFLHFLPTKWHDRFFYLLDVLHTTFRGYIIGQCTEAVILGSLCTVGMLVFKLPYASTIGALVTVTALIPIAGAWIGAIVGALLILPIAPIKALIFLLFILILQQLEGNIIYPKVVGSSIGLPGLWVLAAVTIGGSLFGIPGMFLGVPLVAAIYRILRETIEGQSLLNRPRKKKNPEPPAEAAPVSAPPDKPGP